MAFCFWKRAFTQRRGGREDDSNHKGDTTRNETATSLEAKDSSGSLQSSDSGIELSSGMKVLIDSADVNLQSDMDDDELMMVESDIDTDSDFEGVSSDTELLMKEHRDSLNLESSQAHSYSFKFFKSYTPSFLINQCGP